MDYVLEKKEAARPDKIPAFRMRKQQETVQRQSDASKDTGIPPSLKKRFENLTGYSFNDVKVHYNSEKPARMQALAYTQGNQIYMGPGQEKHLAHELGHVVQQKQGRVFPTAVVEGSAINESPVLEQEADRIASQGLAIRPSLPPVCYGRNGNIIQKKGRVMVSLSIDNENTFSASEIQVDTVKLSERFDTGLAGGKEGDHTISDVVNKKYQKLMVRNKSVADTLAFYRGHSQQLILENNRFWGVDNEEDADKMVEAAEEMEQTAKQETAKAFGCDSDETSEFVSDRDIREETMEEQLEVTMSEVVEECEKNDVFVSDSQIRKMAEKRMKGKPPKAAAKKADKANAYKDIDTINAFRKNFVKRYEESNRLSEGVIGYIDKVAGECRKVKEWRHVIENIIYAYNSALAKGMFTTSPMATGGKGEKEGKNAIRSYASRPVDTKEKTKPDEETDEEAERLKQLVGLPNAGQVLDISSAKALVVISGGVEDIPAYLMSKTAYMVNHMKARYREKEEETRQWLWDNPLVWLPDIDAAFNEFVRDSGLEEELYQFIIQVNESCPGNNMRFIREEFLKTFCVQAALSGVKSIIEEFSSDDLKKLRERYWHSIL